MSWRDETRSHYRWQQRKEDARMYALIAGIMFGRAVLYGIGLGVVAVVATWVYRIFI